MMLIQRLVIIYWLPLLVMVIVELTQGRNTLKLSIRDVTFSLHTQNQAHVVANGLVMGEVDLKDSTGLEVPDHQQELHQQQQIQLQQLQLQQLEQQQAMLQQQHVQQGRSDV